MTPTDASAPPAPFASAGRAPALSRPLAVARWASGPPAAGRIRVARVTGGPPRVGSVAVSRNRPAVPRPGSRLVTPQPERTIGDTGLGRVSIADGVVAMIASRAVLDVPDAGGVAPSVLGLRLPGGHLGVRETSLDSIPKTTATVDGTTAFVSTTLSVRWPASIAATAAAVRTSIRGQVEHMANVSVAEIEIHITAVTDRAPARPRVQ